MNKVLIGIAVFSVLFSFGCQVGPSGNGFQEVRVVDVELADDAKNLNEAAGYTADDLDAADTTIAIVDDDVQVDEYAVGSVLYIEDENAEAGAVIKKVTGVTNTADGVEVTTERATVVEAFDSMDIHVKAQLGAEENFAVRTVDGVRFTGVTDNSRLSRSFQTIDDKNYSIPGLDRFFGFKLTDFPIWDDGDDIVTLDGLLYVSLVGEFKLNYYTDEVTGDEVLTGMSFELSGRQYMELSKSLDLSLLSPINHEVEIGTLSFPIYPGLTLDVDLYVGFDAEANITLYAGFKEWTTVQAGIHYDGSAWSYTYSDDAQNELIPLEFSGSASFRPYAGVGVGASLLGVGVEINTEIYTLVEAECSGGVSIDDFEYPYLDTLWLDGSLDVDLGVRMEAATDIGWLGIIGFTDYSQTLADYSVPLLSLPSMAMAEDMPIVFGSLRSGDDGDIYTMSLSGNTVQQITMNDSGDWHPGWSPDRSEIVFCSDRDGSADIYLMNADGSNVRRLTTDPGEDNHPMFSPDGTTVVFESDRYGSKDIFTIDTDGNNLTRLTDAAYDEERASYSSDGSTIVYTGMVSGGEIFSMAPDGSSQVQLTDDDVHYWGPDMSPDGNSIVFTGYAWNSLSRSMQDDIYLLDIGTGDIEKLTSNRYYDQHPNFSADGSEIIYTSQQGSFSDEAYEICRMNADGTDKRTISDDQYWDYYVEWDS